MLESDTLVAFASKVGTNLFALVNELALAGPNCPTLRFVLLLVNGKPDT